MQESCTYYSLTLCQSKGMMFAWVKKFIAAKYPALQVEFRPHFLRKALDREIYAGRVELVSVCVNMHA